MREADDEILGGRLSRAKAKDLDTACEELADRLGVRKPVTVRFVDPATLQPAYQEPDERLAKRARRATSLGHFRTTSPDEAVEARAAAERRGQRLRERDNVRDTQTEGQA